MSAGDECSTQPTDDQNVAAPAPQSAAPTFWRRAMRYLVISVVTALIGTGLIGVLLYMLQEKIIYLPQPYRADYERLKPPGTIELSYQTKQGRQIAFYVPPIRDGSTTAPRRLWTLFGGNGSLALFWGDIVESTRDKEAGHLLIDYPGYGKCEGRPTPASIQESAEAALNALALRLNVSVEALESDLNLMGHSLGAAAAAQFAMTHPTKRIVLLAPFTSMADMATLRFGRIIGPLVRHRFDNRARLAELYSSPQRPRVVIVHGTADEIIPVDMGRELAEEFPEMTELHEIPDGFHIDAVDEAIRWMRPF